MPAYIQTILFLICSNIFMTFAWSAHLKNLNSKPLWLAIIMSWGVAFFEYVFQVPGNRIGFNQASLSLAQLKIIQEVITLSVFILFAVYYMDQPINWNYLYAGLCLVGAVYFIFKPI
jgi:uncharacterized protein (DUF486 family)